jgi:CheY-like chemotaxis protein
MQTSGNAERHDALARFGRITSELLHDLGGGLALLSARLAVVEETAGRGPTAAFELAAAREDVEELRGMIREVLDELRGSSTLNRRSFHPAGEVEASIDRWFRKGVSTPLRLRCTLAPEVRVAGPRTLFTRTVSNLVRNATRHARSRVLVTLAPGGEGLGDMILTVEDDGAGIPAELVSRLLEPFEADAPGGHGLGLSFCAWAAERMGGTLTVPGPSDRLGGACFELRLPLLSRPRPVERQRAWLPARTGGPTPPPEQTPLPDLLEGLPALRPLKPGAGGPVLPVDPVDPPRVVVVDDDPAVARVFTRRLVRSGFGARESPPLPGDTPAVLAERLAEEGFDLALIDVNLGPFSGVQVARILEVAAPGSPVLLITGGDTESPDPAFPLLHKLDDWATICETLRRVLGPSADA